MLRKYIEIRERVLAAGREEEGSEVAQATGVGLLSLALITGVLAKKDDLKTAVEKVFGDLLSAIGG